MAGEGEHIPNKVDFVVYPKDVPQCQILYKFSHHVEPMAFPLLLPNGNLIAIVHSIFHPCCHKRQSSADL